MVELKNVCFSYESSDEGNADAFREGALRHISLRVPKGECVLLCGASGSGKSTILKLINGIIPHFAQGNLSGDVCLDGRKVLKQPLYERARLVASVFQNPKSQFFHTDVESEVAYALENRGIPAEEIDRRLECTLRELNLAQLRGKSMFALSGGEKQQVAFASAYMNDAPIVVLDEPTANLDEQAIMRIREIVLKMKAQGKTILIAEHRLSWLKGIVDTVYLVEEGKIKGSYRQNDFFALSAEERIALGLRCLRETDGIMPQKKEKRTDKQQAILSVKNLCLSYKKRIIQENLAFDAYEGEIIGIVGKNGAGKTTLLRSLAGLDKNKQGKICFRGKAISAKARRKIFGMVMQDVNAQLFSDSVVGECMLGNPFVPEKRVKEILKGMLLEQYEDKHPQSLSGGQKQRVAIATAYASEKEILLLDEPTSGLDYRSMIAVRDALRRLSQNGVLIFVVTHDRELIKEVCDRVIEFTV